MPLRQSNRRGPWAFSWSRAVLVVGVTFAFVCAAFGSIAPKAVAQDFFQQLFGGGQDYRYQDYRYRARPSYAPERWSRHRWRAARPADRHGGGRTPSGQERAVFSESASGSRSYCVRECDGYFFPVGVYSSASDTASHQRTCNKLCPGAKTTLYVMRSGSDKIEDAVAARGGTLYTRLISTLQRRGDTDKECSCHASGAAETPASAIYHDFTLRRGDAVMTPHGMEVFHGGAHYPYTTSDFRSLAETRDLPERTRRMLATLERASKHGRGGNERRAKLLGEHRSQSGGRDDRQPRE